MHGLSPDEEIDYWRERAQRAEAELRTARIVVAAAEAHHEAESAEIGISIDDASDVAVRIRQRKWKTLDALRAAIDHHRRTP